MNRLPEATTRRAAPVTQHLAAFFRDLVRLVELQAQLFVVDLQACRARLVSTLVLLAVGLVVGMSCIPVALLGLAWLLAENTALTMGQACLLSVAGGALVAIAATASGYTLWRRFTGPLARSQTELVHNMAWVKAALERLCDTRHLSDTTRESNADHPPF